MKTRPALAGDVAYVGAHMWERGKLELEAYGLGLHDYQDIYAGARYVFCTEHDGEPLAVLGLLVDGDSARSCYHATTRFDEFALDLSEELRKQIDDVVPILGVKTVHVYSLCTCPKAPRWFRMLGFDEDITYQGGQHGNYRERLFSRHWE